MASALRPDEIMRGGDGSAHAGEAAGSDPLPAVSPGMELAGIVAAPARMIAWAEHARAGDVFVYATRRLLPPGSEGAACVRTLAEAGLVHPTQRALPGRLERNYQMQRTSRVWCPVKVRPAPRGIVERAPDDEAVLLNALLPILTRAARFGRPCPTDKQLAIKCGVDVGAVQSGLFALRAINAIRVQPAKAPTMRLITIVATGHKTGLVGQ